MKEDGDVEGCEIVVPKAKFTETWQFVAASVTPEYKAKVYDLVGCTNQSAFRGCAARRVLFLGAAGQRSARNPDVVEITFEFAVGRHRTGVTIGDIADVAKEAWDYLWVDYETVTSGTPPRKARRPVAVHVEQVYYPDDFATLGIGE